MRLSRDEIDFLLGLDRIFSVPGLAKNIDSSSAAQLIHRYLNLADDNRQETCLILTRVANGILKFVDANSRIASADEILSRTQPLLAEIQRTLKNKIVAAAASPPATFMLSPFKTIRNLNRTVLITTSKDVSGDSLSWQVERLLPHRFSVISYRGQLPARRSSGAWYEGECGIASIPSKQTQRAPEWADFRIVYSWEELGRLVQDDSCLYLLNSMPIIPAKIINSTRSLVVNIHNGLLPWIRGLDAPAWSLAAGVPLGLTMHRVSAGVDTGEIIAHEIVNSPTRSAFHSGRSQLISKVFEAASHANPVQSLQIRPGMMMQKSAQNLPLSQFHELHADLRRIFSNALV